MLLRFLGLILLSTLCWTQEDVQEDIQEDVADDTQFFNEETNEFEYASPEVMNRIRRSMEASPMGPIDTSVMFPDTSICDSMLNSDPVSMDQIPFFCLCAHCKATTGPKGERGDKGLPGFQGSPGRRGFMGYPGRRGFAGPMGIKGQKGDQGDKGQSGAIGYPGMKGELGTKGEKGDHGDDGPAGALGPQGVPGDCLCEAVIGPPGVQGPPGRAGARGLPGIPGTKGAAGAKGDKGDMGVDGRHGADGLKGEQGEPGACDCTDGEDGADGSKGEKGETGGKGETGPKGDNGDSGMPGEVGDPGRPGIPGPCQLAVQSAFSVALQSAFPAPNQPVRFTKSIYNVQGHYNHVLGIFIAPAAGMYVFNFNLAVKDRILVAGLFHNFNSVLKITQATNMATTSQKVLRHLEARDLVWVQVKDADSNGMYAGAEISSTFSGFMVSPDVCDFGINRDFEPIDENEYLNIQYPWK